MTYRASLLVTLAAVAVAASCQVPAGGPSAADPSDVHRYTHTGRVEWSHAPSYPVEVTLVDEASFDVVARVRVTKDASFTLDAEVAAGMYVIRSQLLDNWPPKEYWDAYGTRVIVGADGEIEETRLRLEHLRVMRPIGPRGLARVNDRRPTLRWEPEPSASYYLVGWSELDVVTGAVTDRMSRARTFEPEYTFDKDIVRGRRYEWNVEAYDPTQEEFAYYAGVHFMAAPH